MKRITYTPRADWKDKVASLGLSYHTIDNECYWDESAHYHFTRFEIDILERATRELQRICIEGAEIAIRENWRGRLQIKEHAWNEIVKSWERDDLSLYGRFDMLWNGNGTPKLMEYNADTPTGLLEASVVQWHWLEEAFPRRDQFNSIHEKLVASWQSWPSSKIHFCAQQEAEEDWRTILYLQDTCQNAGKETANLAVEEIGWNPALGRFVDQDNVPVDCLFKLYPWEWMWDETFAKHLPGQCHAFIEPVWKMLWSNKAFLVLLWEKFEGHPNLLRAGFSPDQFGGNYAEKPIFGREGANVRLVERGSLLDHQEGPWGNQPVIYQALHPEVRFSGNHPVIGSWVIGGEAAGIGIREDSSRITANSSRFVPHCFGDMNWVF